jgi:hypothetical protein
MKLPRRKFLHLAACAAARRRGGRVAARGARAQADHFRTGGQVV